MPTKPFFSPCPKFKENQTVCYLGENYVIRHCQWRYDHWEYLLMRKDFFQIYGSEDVIREVKKEEQDG